MAPLVGPAPAARARSIALAASVTLALVAGGCGRNAALYDPTPEMLSGAAPDSFLVGVETSEGYFEVRMRRHWSPQAVDRVYHLARNDFYAGARIYRVVPGFVAQWGYSGDPELDSLWRARPIDDEPPVGSNLRGVVSFARSGPRTRSYTLYVNLEDNTRLDTASVNGVVGYPPIGVMEGPVDVVQGFYSAYDIPEQDSVRLMGNDYLRRAYPQLDSIIGTRIVRSWQ